LRLATTIFEETKDYLNLNWNNRSKTQIQALVYTYKKFLQAKNFPPSNPSVMGGDPMPRIGMVSLEKT
jgi:hypothetical protein